VRYLVQLGHRKIGLLTSPLTTRSGRLHCQAYRDALEEVKVHHDPSLIRLRHELPSNGYQATLELLRGSRRPTALIVAANQLTFGALLAIKESGLRVPKDISLVGSDEGFLSTVVDPPLTVIAQDMRQFGRYAVEFLLARMAGNQEPVRTATVRSEIVLRQSCTQCPA
jgi:LacI family transcriptional regulator